jgi:tetratricopeptide (TPR) repeat protein
VSRPVRLAPARNVEPARRSDAKIQAVPETVPKASYSREEVRRLLAVSEAQLRGWERQSLIRPAQTFTLPDLIALRTLVKLRRDRIPAATIRAALTDIRQKLRDVNDPLRELKVIAEGKRIRVEISSGQHMEALSGQLLLNFDGDELRRLLTFPTGDRGAASVREQRDKAEKWFRKGLQLEQAGASGDAIAAYETAVQLDPKSAGAWVNLGTIYFNARQFGKAEAYYRRALEADSGYALAHFNIGNLHDERGDYERALHHYRHAVQLSPQYADAHYNLALLYQSAGHVMEAVRHWKLYLKLDPGSSWASIARRELDKLRRSTLVRSPNQRKSTGTESVD